MDDYRSLPLMQGKPRSLQLLVQILQALCFLMVWLVVAISWLLTTFCEHVSDLPARLDRLTTWFRPRRRVQLSRDLEADSDKVKKNIDVTREGNEAGKAEEHVPLLEATHKPNTGLSATSTPSSSPTTAVNQPTSQSNTPSDFGSVEEMTKLLEECKYRLWSGNTNGSLKDIELSRKLEFELEKLRPKTKSNNSSQFGSIEEMTKLLDECKGRLSGGTTNDLLGDIELSRTLERELHKHKPKPKSKPLPPNYFRDICRAADLAGEKYGGSHGLTTDIQRVKVEDIFRTKTKVKQGGLREVETATQLVEIADNSLETNKQDGGPHQDSADTQLVNSGDICSLAHQKGAQEAEKAAKHVHFEDEEPIELVKEDQDLNSELESTKDQSPLEREREALRKHCEKTIGSPNWLKNVDEKRRTKQQSYEKWGNEKLGNEQQPSEKLTSEKQPAENPFSAKLTTTEKHDCPQGGVVEAKETCDKLTPMEDHDAAEGALTQLQAGNEKLQVTKPTSDKQTSTEELVAHERVITTAEDLEDRNAKLEKRLAAANDYIEEYQRSNTKLADESMTAQAERDRAQKECKQAEHERDQAEAERDQAQAQRNDFQAKLAHAQQQPTVGPAELVRAQEQLEVMTKERDGLRNEFNKCHEAYKQGKEFEKHLKGKIEGQEGELKKCIDANTEANRQREHLQNDLNRCIDANKSANTLLNQARDDHQKLQDECQTVQEERDHYRHLNQQGNDSTFQVLNAIQQLQSEKAELEERLKGQSAYAGSNEKMVPALQNRNAELEKQVRMLTDPTAREHNVLVDQLRTKIVELQGRCQDTYTRSIALETKVNLRELQIHDLEKEVATLGKVRDAGGEKALLQREIQGLMSDKVALFNAKKGAASEIQKLKVQVGDLKVKARIDTSRKFQPIEDLAQRTRELHDKDVELSEARTAAAGLQKDFNVMAEDMIFARALIDANTRAENNKNRSADDVKQSRQQVEMAGGSIGVVPSRKREVSHGDSSIAPAKSTKRQKDDDDD